MLDKFKCITIDVYRQPELVEKFSLSQWESFIRQARRANVLPRIAYILKDREYWATIPTQAKQHLNSAIVTADAVARSIRWEVMQINRALIDTGISPIYLKGAAYELIESAPAAGRVYHDIDFLVRKTEINKVEKALLIHGWVSTHLDPYDQRYYRKWMHEIPPLKHFKRHSILDVHHAILPETAKLHPDSNKLISDAVDHMAPGIAGKVLSPVDRVLHSATHLFNDGELEQGLRDLMDLDLMFAEQQSNTEFWQALVPRAQELELTLPLVYAVRYCHLMLKTNFPDSTLELLNKKFERRLNWRLMDALFLRALLPDHASCRVKMTGIARWMLYVRAHYLRMPLYLLLPHLLRKMFSRQSK